MELNANINLQAKDGRTPLHMTAINGRFTRAQMLLDHGALVDVGDKEGLSEFLRLKFFKNYWYGIVRNINLKR